MQKKAILCILDGWGCSSKKSYNAIHLADTPCLDYLVDHFPNSRIKTSGHNVGLPEMQMGNSEVGHTTIGAGRIITQDLERINCLVSNEDNLRNNTSIQQLVKASSHKICHLFSMISDGGVHSHIYHLIKIAKFLQANNVKIKLHAFTDGRDSLPKQAKQYIKELINNNIEIVSVSGRYYSMDRNNKWDRTKVSYDAITAYNSPSFYCINDYINENYNNGITDEFIKPAYHKSFTGIKNNDSLLFLNFRVDRINQITESLVLPDFHYFKINKYTFSYIGTLVYYSDKLKDFTQNIISPIAIVNDLGQYLSSHNLRQLRIAETEKYPHVTYFFNCGREKRLNQEQWLLISSPDIKTYNLKPEMSAYIVTKHLVSSIRDNKFDFICVNYANADMVGHTGNINATIKACSTVDKCLSQLIKECYHHNYELLITADHGNAEEMRDIKNGQKKTSHTLNDVPLIYYGKKDITLRNGKLSDIAPTILQLLQLPKPIEMTGCSLINS